MLAIIEMLAAKLGCLRHCTPYPASVYSLANNNCENWTERLNHFERHAGKSPETKDENAPLRMSTMALFILQSTERDEDLLSRLCHERDRPAARIPIWRDA